MHGDRLVLRDQAARRTIAGGTIIDPLSPAHIAFLKTTEIQDAELAMARLLDQACHGVELDHFTASRPEPETDSASA